MGLNEWCKKKSVLRQAALEGRNNPNKKGSFNVSYGIGDVKSLLNNGSKLRRSVLLECNSDPKIEGTTSDQVLALGTPLKGRNKPLLASE